MNSIETFELRSCELDEVNGGIFGFVRNAISTAYAVGYALGRASK